VSICQGDVRNTPVELQEIHYPFLIECLKLREDSGGAGEFRGGLGLEMRYRSLGRSTINVNLERTFEPPWGMEGGKPGQGNLALIHSADGTERYVKKETNIGIGTGDTVSFWTAGGGGYGAAARRDPASIRQDLLEGYVSIESVQRDYGAAANEKERA
jgi:N-methylhydantoinase B